MERPDFFTLKNGEKVKLPFSDLEYNRRVNNLRIVMDQNNLDMVILTSMHNIAYYTGFIYCSFGRPYGCVVTKNKKANKAVKNGIAAKHNKVIAALVLVIENIKEIIAIPRPDPPIKPDKPILK